MARYDWLVFSNCAPGEDDSFNRWYDEIHIPDLLRIPGVVGATRSRLSAPQLRVNEDGSMDVCDAEGISARFGYLAVYELETDDPERVLDEVIKRAGTPEMLLSEHLGEVYTTLYEAI
ncbi:MAG TPA: hypothetical protein VJM34_10370 [Novosphingobium sp.]|nr:hypothetical protein [Novosphingobium sp.]